jgi:hypothetical protein
MIAEVAVARQPDAPRDHAQFPAEPAQVQGLAGKELSGVPG